MPALDAAVTHTLIRYPDAIFEPRHRFEQMALTAPTHLRIQMSPIIVVRHRRHLASKTLSKPAAERRPQSASARPILHLKPRADA